MDKTFITQLNAAIQHLNNLLNEIDKERYEISGSVNNNGLEGGSEDNTPLKIEVKELIKLS